jgi:DUF218 domain
MSEREPFHEQEPREKGIAFVFSYSVESDNPNVLSKQSIERLNKALELHQAGKIAYILVSGGEFEPGLKKPLAKMMTDYLIERGVSSEEIIEERHSRDTTSNVLFGTKILELKKLDSLKVYYISSGYHLPRIETIVRGQKKLKVTDEFVSSGRDEVPGGLKGKMAQTLGLILNYFDPEGRSLLAQRHRAKRAHPIKHIK